eukprot:366130-Chlamydomonas_euryale.AAC.52
MAASDGMAAWVGTAASVRRGAAVPGRCAAGCSAAAAVGRQKSGAAASARLATTWVGRYELGCFPAPAVDRLTQVVKAALCVAMPPTWVRDRAARETLADGAADVASAATWLLRAGRPGVTNASADSRSRATPGVAPPWNAAGFALVLGSDPVLPMWPALHACPVLGAWLVLGTMVPGTTDEPGIVAGGLDGARDSTGVACCGKPVGRSRPDDSGCVSAAATDNGTAANGDAAAGDGAIGGATNGAVANGDATIGNVAIANVEIGDADNGNVGDVRTAAGGEATAAGSTAVGVADAAGSMEAGDAGPTGSGAVRDVGTACDAAFSGATAARSNASVRAAVTDIAAAAEAASGSDGVAVADAAATGDASAADEPAQVTLGLTALANGLASTSQAGSPAAGDAPARTSLRPPVDGPLPVTALASGLASTSQAGRPASPGLLRPGDCIPLDARMTLAAYGAPLCGTSNSGPWPEVRCRCVGESDMPCGCPPSLSASRLHTVPPWSCADRCGPGGKPLSSPVEASRGALPPDAMSSPVEASPGVLPPGAMSSPVEASPSALPPGGILLPVKASLGALLPGAMSSLFKALPSALPPGVMLPAEVSPGALPPGAMSSPVEASPGAFLVTRGSASETCTASGLLNGARSSSCTPCTPRVRDGAACTATSAPEPACSRGTSLGKAGAAVASRDAPSTAPNGRGNPWACVAVGWTPSGEARAAAAAEVSAAVREAFWAVSPVPGAPIGGVLAMFKDGAATASPPATPPESDGAIGRSSTCGGGWRAAGRLLPSRAGTASDAAFPCSVLGSRTSGSDACAVPLHASPPACDEARPAAPCEPSHGGLNCWRTAAADLPP